MGRASGDPLFLTVATGLTGPDGVPSFDRQLADDLVVIQMSLLDETQLVIEPPRGRVGWMVEQSDCDAVGPVEEPSQQRGHCGPANTRVLVAGVDHDPTSPVPLVVRIPPEHQVSDDVVIGTAAGGTRSRWSSRGTTSATARPVLICDAGEANPSSDAVR